MTNLERTTKKKRTNKPLRHDAVAKMELDIRQ